MIVVSDRKPNLFTYTTLFRSRLLKALPGVEDRLAANDDHAWTQTFLEAVAAPEKKESHPELRARELEPLVARAIAGARDRKSTRLNSSHITNSYAVICLKKQK